MKYLVILDPDTVVGRAYLGGSSDYTVKDGDGGDGLPALTCSKIEDRGAYLYVERNMRAEGGGRQTLHLPHHCIAWIFQYDSDDDVPPVMGFRLEP